MFIIHINVDQDLIICFPRTPLMRFNFMSLSYDIRLKTTNVLLRECEIVGPRSPEEWKAFKDKHDFNEALQAFDAHLAHPLLVPAILLQFFMFQLENMINNNVKSMGDLEDTVEKLSSFAADMKPMAEREDVTHVLTELHNTLKTGIKCLDSVRWAHRAAALLCETGDDLRLKLAQRYYGKLLPLSAQFQDDWAEIRQFLEDIVFLTTNLEPEPIMTQQRCQSQIDIVSFLFPIEYPKSFTAISDR